MVTMESHFLTIFSLLSVVVIGSNAALPAEVFWHSKLPNTPLPRDILHLLQSDMADNITFWDIGYKTIQEPTYDRREKYKRYGADPTEERKEKYKRYGSQFAEPTEDRREKYKRYDSEFAEPTEDRREKYKRYGIEFTEPTAEPTEDRREKYKRYGAEFPEPNEDRREKYKRYDAEFPEPTGDRREKYKRYDSEFAEPTEDRREKYKRYDSEFAEPTEDRREKYKRYDSEFVEPIEDKREKYKRYDSEFAEPTEDRREKYKRYNSHANKHKLPNSTVFFVFEDLHAGKKMTTHLTTSTNKARILPHQVAESIPFSTDKFSEILERFSVEPSSPQAKLMKQTLVDCESPGIKGEDRFCSTSLESIAEFSLKHVSDNAQILMNEVDRPRIPQEYTITDVKYVGEKEMVCHKQKYPYAVYYCHSLTDTKVYNTEMVGADGSKAKAVAICHSDTSDWHPKHLAFLLLNMKPGEGTICHFIRSDTFVVVSGEKIAEKASTETDLLAKT